MKLQELGEDRVVEALCRGLPVGPDVVCAAGDDCAVIEGGPDGKFLLLKTDCVVEGVHFLRTHPPRQIGWKALCRALSDIAAMAGSPGAALVTVAAPPDLRWSQLAQIYAGLRRAARCYGVSLVGGETARSPGPLFLNVALTGTCAAPPVLRSGARPGDLLVVTGQLGGSFRSGRHLKFRPRLEQALWLRRMLPPTAMMDLSDGLAADLPRLARRSRVGYEIDCAALPLAPGCGIEQALRDGEDYELLFTAPPSDWPRVRAAWRRKFPSLPLTRIGRIVRRGKTALGMAGFQHFAPGLSG